MVTPNMDAQVVGPQPTMVTPNMDAQVVVPPSTNEVSGAEHGTIVTTDGSQPFDINSMFMNNQ